MSDRTGKWAAFWPKTGDKWLKGGGLITVKATSFNSIHWSKNANKTIATKRLSFYRWCGGAVYLGDS